MKPFFFLFCAAAAFSADINVGTDALTIQQALDKASCGDRILIPPRTYTEDLQFRTQCTANNPVTVTTSMYAWLPLPGQRITPSYIYGAGGPLLPTLTNKDVLTPNTPVMTANLTRGGNPADSWTFVGLSFRPFGDAVRYPGNTSAYCSQGYLGNAIVRTGGAGWPYTYADLAHVPDNIVFDRILIMGGNGNQSSNVCASRGITMNVRSSGAIKNSFITDISHDYQETHSIDSIPASNGLIIYNNYLAAESISGWFNSGGPGDFAGGKYSNWTAAYNYATKPVKLWGGSLYQNCSDACGDEILNIAGRMSADVAISPSDTSIQIVCNGFWPCDPSGAGSSDGGTFLLDNERVHITSASNGNTQGAWPHMTATVVRGVADANGNATTPASHSTSATVQYVNPTPNPHGTIATAKGHPEDDWVTGYGYDHTMLAKNMWEFKSIDGGYVAYNVGEFNPGIFQGQSYGMTITPRSSMGYYGADSGCTPATQCFDENGVPIALTTTAGSVNFAWTGRLQSYGTWNSGGVRQRGNYSPLLVGDVVCSLQLVPGATGDPSVNNSAMQECRKILTLNQTATCNPACTGTVDEPWDTTVTATKSFHIGVDEAWYRNVTIENNVFRNVATPWQHLARTGVAQSTFNAGGGHIKNLIVRNNLSYQTMKMPAFQGMSHMAAQEFTFRNSPNVASEGYLFEHNTHDYRYTPTSTSFIFTANTQSSSVDTWTAKWTGLKILSNIFPASQYGVTADGLYGQQTKVFQNYIASDLVLSNNHMYSSSASPISCYAGQTCTGLITGHSPDRSNYLDADTGNYKVKPGSEWAKAGTDGHDLGADYDKLPLIKNARVVARANAAVLEYDVSAVNDKIPQVLEVSAATQTLPKAGGGTQWYPCLASTLCPYVVLPSLDPTLFQQPDSSERTNSKLLPVVHEGLHRSWPICWTGTANDDRTGAARNFACAANTTYYYRLMAGGDTVTGSFTTGAAGSVNSLARVIRRITPPSGTTTVRLNYGDSPAVGNHVEATPDADGGVSIDVPISEPLFTQVIYLNNGNPGYASPVKLTVVR